MSASATTPPACPSASLHTQAHCRSKQELTHGTWKEVARVLFAFICDETNMVHFFFDINSHLGELPMEQWEGVKGS